MVIVMRWEDEPYVKVYTRNTPEWCALSWEARAVLLLLLREVDRAGVLRLGKLGLAGAANLVRVPKLSFEGAIAELLQDGCVKIVDENLVLPNFVEAQAVHRLDRATTKASRIRAKDEAMAKSATEGPGNLVSAPLDKTSLSRQDPPLSPRPGGYPEDGAEPAPTPTQRSEELGPATAEPIGQRSLQLPDITPTATPKPSRRKPTKALPADWQPNDHAYQVGSECGYDRNAVDANATRFRGDALAHDRRYADWHQAFYNWLRNQQRYDARGFTARTLAPRYRVQPGQVDLGRIADQRRADAAKAAQQTALDEEPF